MTRQHRDSRGTSLQSIPGPAHSTLAGLTADPDHAGYAVDPAGRRYFLTHAADGSTIPIPVELTDDQRAELDAARDRAAGYAGQLALDADDALTADVVQLPLPDEGGGER